MEGGSCQCDSFNLVRVFCIDISSTSLTARGFEEINRAVLAQISGSEFTPEYESIQFVGHCLLLILVL